MNFFKLATDISSIGARIQVTSEDQPDLAGLQEKMEKAEVFAMTPGRRVELVEVDKIGLAHDGSVIIVLDKPPRDWKPPVFAIPFVLLAAYGAVSLGTAILEPMS